MIRVDMTSPDLDRQIELLKVYPEIVEKHFVPTLKRDVKALEARIRPTIPRLSGRAQKTFGSKVTGKGINLTGRVGWSDRSDPWYPNVLEYGAKAHAMNTFVPRLSKRIKTHPGFSARGFMQAGYKSMEPLINADLAQANEGVVQELAIK
jgi:hypothetical protein